MSRHALARMLFVLAGCLPLVLARHRSRVRELVWRALLAWSLAHLAFLASLCVEHLRFPASLEPMETTLLEHARRAAALEPIYPPPSHDFVALAYNPGYYLLAAPFVRLAGAELPVLRAVSVVAAASCLATIFAAVRRHTSSRGWALAAAGLFAAAYRAMDACLDVAHADATFLAATLAGTLALERARTTAGRLGATALLVAAFWCKQHGALFVLGGLAAIALRDGPRRALPGAVLALALGPGLYLLAGPALFGSHFHYFTWEVPRRWSEPTLAALLRCVTFLATAYGPLALALVLAGALARDRARVLDPWHAQLVAALASALMGSLDPASLDNVYVPAGTLLIVTGTRALHALGAVARAPALALLVAAHAGLLYDPRPVLVDRAAPRRFAELVSLLRSLEGPVYAPWQGPLPGGPRLFPGALEIALEDLVRGPGRQRLRHPDTLELLRPVLAPGGCAWVLAHHPLAPDRFLGFLAERYVLVADLGDRFRALRGLPRRFDNGWPRYLYRYQGPGCAGPAAAIRLP